MSLRLRLVVAGALAIILALGLAAAGMAAFFCAHVERRTEVELSAQPDQILAGLDLRDGKVVMAIPPAGSRFAHPYSVHYWQVVLPDTRSGRARFGIPRLSCLLRRQLRDRFGHIGSQARTANSCWRWGVLWSCLRGQQATALIATDRAQIIAAQRGFAADLMPYILALAGVLIAAGRVQITVGLQPLALLRSRVTGLRAQPDNRMSADWPANWPANWPVKVRMFAAELDSLLALRATDLEWAQMRAGDLAQELKTPLQALMAQATCLHDTGARVNWAVKIPDTLITIPLDQSDLAEALGAVIQNAVRHVKSAVRICLRVTATGPCLCVDLHFPTPPAKV